MDEDLEKALQDELSEDIDSNKLNYGDYLLRFPKFPFIQNFACMYFLPVQPLMQMKSRDIEEQVYVNNKVKVGNTRVSKSVQSYYSDKDIYNGQSFINKMKDVHNAFQNMLKDDTSKVRNEYLEQSRMIEEKYFPQPFIDGKYETNSQNIKLRAVDYVLPLCIYLNLKANGRLEVNTITKQMNGNVTEKTIHHPSVLEVNLLQQILTSRYRLPFLPDLHDLKFILNEDIQEDVAFELEIQNTVNYNDYLENPETLSSIFMKRNFNAVILAILAKQKDTYVKMEQFNEGNFHKRIPMALVGDVYNLVDRLLKQEFESDDFCATFVSTDAYKVRKKMNVLVKGKKIEMLGIFAEEKDTKKKIVWKRLLSEYAEMSDETINELNFSMEPFKNFENFFIKYNNVMQNILIGHTKTTLEDTFINSCISLHNQIETIFDPIIYTEDYKDEVPQTLSQNGWSVQIIKWIKLLKTFRKDLNVELNNITILLSVEGFINFMKELKNYLFRYLKVHYNAIIRIINRVYFAEVQVIKDINQIPNFLQNSINTLKNIANDKKWQHRKINAVPRSHFNLQYVKNVLASMKSVVDVGSLEFKLRMRYDTSDIRYV
jgi:hypothetical protein